MKLLVVTPYFYPKLGGLENYAYNFCIALKKQYKWNIVVVTSNHEKKKNTVETLNGLKIYRLAPLFKFSNTPINPLWYWRIKKIVQEEKPDVINAHTPVPFIADVAAIVAKKIPFFVTYHAFKLHKHNFTLFNILISLYKKIEHFLFKKADKIIIVSDVIQDIIPDQFKDKVETIYNAISINDVPKIKELNIDKKIKLVFIGSLDKSHEWKGLQEILLAVKQYKATIQKDIQLLVIGDGDNKSKYQHRVKEYGIEKNVKFLGKKYGKEKQAILKNATIGIIYPKSSNDAFPTVSLEYWAYSLPIIASNILPINKILKNKKNAYVVQSKNPNILAKAINNIITNKSLAKAITKAGYQELQKKYILENEIKKFYSLTKEYSL